MPTVKWSHQKLVFDDKSKGKALKYADALTGTISMCGADESRPVSSLPYRMHGKFCLLGQPLE